MLRVGQEGLSTTVLIILQHHLVEHLTTGMYHCGISHQVPCVTPVDDIKLEQQFINKTLLDTVLYQR